MCRNIVLQNENCSYQDILQPFIDDLKTLATKGINIDLNGAKIKVYGAVAAVSADNLGAHQLGGFTKSFSNGSYNGNYNGNKKSRATYNREFIVRVRVVNTKENTMGSSVSHKCTTVCMCVCDTSQACKHDISIMLHRIHVI